MSAGADPPAGPPLDPDPGAIDRSVGFDPSFSLGAHLARTGLVAASLLVLGLLLVRHGPAGAWALSPLYLFVGNVVEWTVHRYPMHRPLWPRILYRNHALVHHRAFRGRAMAIERVEDLSLVMMPWYTLAMIFAGAAPMMAAVGLLLGPGHAGVFLVTAVAYFVIYETIHTLDHLAPERLPRRGPLARGLAFIRRHHHHHHQLRNMTRVNFNVTVPVADRLFGTYETPAPAGAPGQDQAASSGPSSPGDAVPPR